MTSNKNGAATKVEADTENAPSEYFEPYRHYSQVLRAWLVGFGVGVPILLISQSEIVTPVISSEKSLIIFGLFLLGVSAQVLVALLYKYSMAILYVNEYSSYETSSKSIKFANYLGTRFWPDVLGDIVAILSYIVATSLLAHAVLGGIAAA